MEVFVHETYEALSGEASNEVLRIMKSTDNPLLCVASGDTPAGLYKALVQKINNRQLEISSWSFVGLDEWMGMNGNDEGSCRYYVDLQLFRPLAIQESQISFFDGRSPDPQAECKKAEQFIRQKKGIDVAILGLGMNGHIGMNEPGTSPISRSHIARLEPVTQQVGQKYFSKEQQLSEGLTLGLGTLLEAKHIILLANGSHKADIVRRVMEDEISENVPASLLRQHPSLSIYLDTTAASLLQSHRS